jgi:hypothetical protein
MKRLVLIAALALAGACSKPSADDCRKAVLNLQRIRGLDTSAHAPDPEAFVRKCRATGDPKVVRCIIEAKTEGEVARCEPPTTPTTPAPPK